jgi:hypothetical protein
MIPWAAGASDARVETEHWGHVLDVEGLAGRHPLDHVEQHDVAEVPLRREHRQVAADLSGTNEGDL